MQKENLAKRVVREKRMIEYGDISIPYELVRSSRKSYSISIEQNGQVIVKTPLRMSEIFLQEMLAEKRQWLTKNYVRMQEISQNKRENQYSPQVLKALEARYRKAAKEYIPQRVDYYVSQMEWTDEEVFEENRKPYKRITIREQKSRWGSCSGRGTLSFNWRLMLAPPRVLDYVVIHEICHFKHMNHSKEFWEEVAKLEPHYKEYRQWLKDHGAELSL